MHSGYRKKVLIIVSSLAAEGCPQLALQLAHRWQQQGLAVELLCLQAQPDDLRPEFEASDIPIHTFSLGSGLPRWLAGAVALQSGWPLPAEAPGALAHVLTARQLTAAFQRAWLELAELADAIHVLAAWSRDVLLRQGIPASKMHLIHTAGPPPLPPRQRTPMQDGVLRLVYWGRCHPVKGLHLVIEAILGLPRDAPIQLDFFGPNWDTAYGQRLHQQINDDRRFRLMGNLPKDQLLPRLQGYELAVVPSTWLETGPLTVLEAFAAGLPVAGSDLGGIKELLEGVEGCFRLPLEAEAWARLFAQLSANPQPLSMFTSPELREFMAIANELTYIYE